MHVDQDCYERMIHISQEHYTSVSAHMNTAGMSRGALKGHITVRLRSRFTITSMIYTFMIKQQQHTEKYTIYT